VTPRATDTHGVGVSPLDRRRGLPIGVAMSNSRKVRRAKRRSWTLGNLDREQTWVLWFDEDSVRWEIVPYDVFKFAETMVP
jgi:hypothetical protein